MVVHLVVAVQIVLFLIFVQLEDEVKRTAVVFVTLLEKWAFGASELHHICDTF